LGIIGKNKKVFERGRGLKRLERNELLEGESRGIGKSLQGGARKLSQGVETLRGGGDTR